MNIDEESKKLWDDFRKHDDGQLFGASILKIVDNSVNLYCFVNCAVVCVAFVPCELYFKINDAAFSKIIGMYLHTNKPVAAEDVRRIVGESI